MSQCTLHLNYVYDKKSIEDDRAKIKDVIDDIIDQVPKGSDDLSKVKFFFEWLCENVDIGQEPHSNEEADSLVDMRPSKGAFINYRATCAGISHAMRALCESSNISCTVIPSKAIMSEPQKNLETSRDARYGGSETT